jgi:N-acetylmuramoyl-L-alanine amidase
VSLARRPGRHAKVDPVIPARRVLPALLAVLVAGALAGCAGDQGAGQPIDPSPAASVSEPNAPDAQPPAPERIILLDPGHNGGNADNLTEINRKVPDGRGGTKPCNTVGTETDPGPHAITEHTFNWYVALDVKSILESNKVKVLMTRDSDEGWGPCVDVRGKMAAKVNADAEISIHADGAPAADHGFHVAYPKPALNSAQGEPSHTLATYLRNGLSDQILPTSTYIGKNGLIGRSDLAGLNLSTRPVALIECGNMKNKQDAINMGSDAGQARYAAGIATAILNWLHDNPPAALASSEQSSLRSTDDETPSTTTRKHSKSSTETTKPSKSHKTTTKKTATESTKHTSTAGTSTGTAGTGDAGVG